MWNVLWFLLIFGKKKIGNSMKLCGFIVSRNIRWCHFLFKKIDTHEEIALGANCECLKQNLQKGEKLRSLLFGPQ